MIGLTGLSVDIDEWLGRAMVEEGKLGFGDWKTYQSNRITGASIERWHELHVSVVARLAPIVESLLDPLGYPQVEIAEKLGPTEARHRYQLRRHHHCPGRRCEYEHHLHTHHRHHGQPGS